MTDERRVQLTPLAAEQLQHIKKSDPEAYEHLQAFLDLLESDPVSAQMISEPITEEDLDDLPPEVRDDIERLGIDKLRYKDV